MASYRECLSVIRQRAGGPEKLRSARLEHGSLAVSVARRMLSGTPTKEELEFALEASKEATEARPKWAPAWQTLGMALLQAGEPRAAIAGLEKAEQVRGGGAICEDYFLLAMAYGRCGPEEAERAKVYHAKGRELMEKSSAVSVEVRSLDQQGRHLLGLLKNPLQEPQER